MYADIKSCDISSFVLFAQDYSGYLGGGVFCASIWILAFSPYFYDDSYWYFEEDCTESIIALYNMGHFSNMNSANPWTWKVFPILFLLQSLSLLYWNFHCTDHSIPWLALLLDVCHYCEWNCYLDFFSTGEYKCCWFLYADFVSNNFTF